jgi:hypothetical protein
VIDVDSIVCVLSSGRNGTVVHLNTGDCLYPEESFEEMYLILKKCEDGDSFLSPP